MSFRSSVWIGGRDGPAPHPRADGDADMEGQARVAQPIENVSGAGAERAVPTGGAAKHADATVPGTV